MIDFRDYPFIATLEEALKRYPGLSLEALLEMSLSSVREHALTLIESIIARNSLLDFECSMEEHILIYYAILFGVKAIGDKRLMHRVAHLYSKRAHDRFVKETSDNLVAIAKALGLDVKLAPSPVRIPVRVVKTNIAFVEKPFAIPLKSFLKTVVGRLSQDPKYSLTNQLVSGGLVYVDRDVLVRLLEERTYRFIMESFEEIEIDIVKIKGFVEEIRQIMDRYGWHKERTSLGLETSVFAKEALPPCIAKLVERLLNGENLSHHERFVVASFLVSIGLGVDQVLEFFKHAPDYNERIARYQVEHIAGLRGSRKKYSPYGCETMKSLGICPISDYCGTNTKNPLGVYRLNLRSLVKRVDNERREIDGDSLQLG